MVVARPALRKTFTQAEPQESGEPRRRKRSSMARAGGTSRRWSLPRTRALSDSRHHGGKRLDWRPRGRASPARQYLGPAQAYVRDSESTSIRQSNVEGSSDAPSLSNPILPMRKQKHPARACDEHSMFPGGRTQDTIGAYRGSSGATTIPRVYAPSDTRPTNDGASMMVWIAELSTSGGGRLATETAPTLSNVTTNS